MERLINAPPPNLARLQDALAGIGVTDLVFSTWHDRNMLRARVPVHVGKFAGQIQDVGWSFPDDSQPFPEYAPHWFHVAGDYDDGKAGARQVDHDESGRLWVAWSRPIGPSWVDPHRTPRHLLRATVARFWRRVQ